MVNNKTLHIYPLIFTPILKERIWGGNNLNTYLNKNVSENDAIGESWEISTVGDDVSIVANGYYKNFQLTQLIDLYPKQILGTKVYGTFRNQFPLLFKFIDASEDLSIQVHPNDEMARKYHNSFGKTEMWYIIRATNNARNIIGFSKDSSAEEYIEFLNKKQLIDILEEIYVKEKDVFFLETGTVHAIGKGILLAEIQQTSDITYRIYDWDRVDNQGNSRELHLDMALESINYKKKNTKLEYPKIANTPNNIVQSPYFSVNYLSINKEMNFNNNGDSFKVYMCVEGSYKLEYNGMEYSFEKGSTILLPAVLDVYTLKGNAELLEIYI
ncbi:MAG: mannose-6-phosphate isomerase [Bacteroidota bacterium]|nr:mannose-6-phosphate isomerase [Bacteroidota bacterium]